MRKRVWVSFLAAGLVLAVLAEAQAYSIQKTGGYPLRWPANIKSIPYVIHEDGSADIQDGSDFAQIQKGFDDWQSNSCTYLSFNYTGTSTSKNVTSLGSWSNGSNEVVWVEDNSWGYGSYVLGVTAPIFSQTGGISEADIAFNGLHHKWSTSGDTNPWGNTQDVLNVAIHEQGHFFGLQHVLGGYSENDPPTMAPTADPYLKTATLEADDIKGICYLYPEGNHSCSSDSDCPYVVDQYSNGQEYYKEKINCEGGTCGGSTSNIPTGGQGLGESCVGDIDCDPPLFCQNTGQGSVCAQECKPSQDNCPSGFECYPYSNANDLGVCLPGSGGGSQGGNKAVGEDCSSSSECASGICVQDIDGSGYICREGCDTSSPNCPSGETCYPLSSGTNSGVCVPSEDGGGDSGLPDGAVCQSSTQCLSELCVGMPGSNLFYCRAQCDPSNGSSCSSNETCWEIQGGGGACLPDEQTSGGGTGGGDGTVSNGDLCSSPADCESGLCVGLENSDAFFCRGTCNTNTGEGCTEDEVCTPLVGDNGEGACLPKEDDSLFDNGKLCSSSSECKSGLCVGSPDGGESTCRNPCDVVTGDGCVEGENCQPLDSEDGSGACFPQSEGKANGESCSDSADCFSGQCVADGSGAGFCTGPCETTADCPCGMGCAETSLGQICFPANQKIKCVGDGDPCASDGECASLSCIGGVCQASCSIHEADSCPVGQVCKRTGLSAQGLCSAPGSKGVNEGCDSDSDCETLYCVLVGTSSYCKFPCNPATGQGCEAPQVCVQIEGYPELGYCGSQSGGGTGGTSQADFDSMDQNGDGLVSQSEYSGSESDFNALDLNGDGFLSADEQSGAFGGPRGGGGGGCQASADQGIWLKSLWLFFLFGWMAFYRRRSAQI